MATPRADLLPLLMRSASAVSERINATVLAAGFTGLRPAHGLVLLRLSSGAATVNDVATFLAVRKQSAAAIVAELVEWDFIVRSPHPDDGRAQLLNLAPRGEQLTQVATEAALTEWHRAAERLGEETMHSAATALELLAEGGTLRPVW